MKTGAQLCPGGDILALREHYREEMNCQITHDSIHRREGWTLSYLLLIGGATAGYAIVAIGGPWKDKPTVIEFFVLPDFRGRVFDLFEAFLATSSARFIEIQTNAVLLTAMLHVWSPGAISEKIVFHDKITTLLPGEGAVFQRVNSLEDSLACVERRQGSSEWQLLWDGAIVARGGIAFHYNRPYGDIYIETAEPLRRRGFGAYLVQELKRICRDELGSIPCARCSPANIASRKTLQKAGFVPCAHILTGSIASH